MASYKVFVISGLLLVTISIVVQSIPIEKAKETVQSSLIDNKQTVDSEKTSSSSDTSSPTKTVSQSSLLTPEKTQEKHDNKKKRFIDDDQLDEYFENESDEVDSNQLPYSESDNNNKNKIDHALHTKIQETSAKIHDNSDKPVDTDNSKVFSDIKMTPNQLTNVLRRRRDVKLNDHINQRRKRALSPYDFYDTDSFYDPYADLIEQDQDIRPTRSFAPLYWYPSVYQRSLRSAFAPSFYESSELPLLYSSTVDDDDDESDETPISILEDENGYESNRYPILLRSSNNPFDNLQLQQQYNIDELPIDEDYEGNFNNDDDDDYDEQYPLLYERESPYFTSYEPIETYF